MPQFNRIVTAEIGEQGTTGFKIDGLRINFDILKTDVSESNKSTIKIYNLAKNTRNSIRELDDTVILRAGYLGGRGEEVLFIGDITFINHQLSGTEWISTLACGDGIKQLRTSKTNRSYAGGVKANKIISDVLSDLDLPQKLKSGLLSISDRVFNSGYSFTGQSKAALDELTKAVGLVWSVQNGEIKIQVTGDSDKSTAIVLNPNTGLIGSPERLRDTDTKSSTDAAKPGWKIVSLLQPKLEPGGIVSVTSDEIPENSQFIIKQVQHTGDSETGVFQSICTVVEQ